MKTDKVYCSSSFLMYRTIADHIYSFTNDITPRFYTKPDNIEQIHDSYELEESLKNPFLKFVPEKKQHWLYPEVLILQFWQNLCQKGLLPIHSNVLYRV